MKRSNRANSFGAANEHIVAAILTSGDVEWERQVWLPCRNIYGYRLRVDFVARNLTAYPGGLIVEVKSQDGHGTTDEKFPYVLRNVRECYPLPTILVLTGSGFRPGAVAWLRHRVDGQKLVAVYNLEELTKWALRAQKLATSPALLFKLR